MAGSVVSIAEARGHPALARIDRDGRVDRAVPRREIAAESVGDDRDPTRLAIADGESRVSIRFS
ncbi:hypothetical protein AB0C34_22745 [Nocardia sp. NPDC049220]|uniref:hypothetical protein n=1 Tax=Nocardia sp. NPDC049220 TaxID=3155273 RepID=UPI0033D13AC7